MMRNRPHLLCGGSYCVTMRTIYLSPRAVAQRGKDERPRRLILLHPAMAYPHHNGLVSSNTLSDFSGGYFAIPTG
ncbi:hypothetical protein TNCV_1313661 [Trichonephila clavipes]|nr:hypothetical protein TNCV_1313661 [Trichonephila clavipes]